MGSCCQNSEAAPRRRIATFIGWFVPAAILAVMPKCPVCVAAYAAALTGIGISISAATYLRASMIVVATAALVAMAALYLVTACKKRRAGAVTRSG